MHLIGKAPVKLKPPERIPANIIKTLDTILPPREFEVNYIDCVPMGQLPLLANYLAQA